MDGEVTLELDGKTYKANFSVVDDELIVGLPDGSLRTVMLVDGMPIELTARNQLRGYARGLERSRS